MSAARSKDELVSREDCPPRVLAVINAAFGGEHHVRRLRRWGRGYAFNVFGGMATYDFNRLTSFVVACHDQCVRGEIEPGGVHQLRVTLFERESRDGDQCWSRHPTLEAHLEKLRRSEPFVPPVRESVEVSR